MTITLRMTTQARAEQPKALQANGKHATRNNHNSMERGTSADYLTARIARDRPDILTKMRAGEYRSVRAAAIDKTAEPQRYLSFPAVTAVLLSYGMTKTLLLY